MRIYVMASSAEIERAKKMMAALRGHGIEVVSTWPEVIEQVGEANPMGAPREQRARWAVDDLNELQQATAAWLLLPAKPSTGAAVELGYAYCMAAMAAKGRELGLPVPEYHLVVSGVETSIFTALSRHFPTDEEALAYFVLTAAAPPTSTAH